jgi:hypothetical protein
MGTANLKIRGGKGAHIDISARNELAAIISLKEWIWDLRGTRKGPEGGRCSLCLGGYNVEHKFKNETAKGLIHSM